jgi:hypothetical protein
MVVDKAEAGTKVAVEVTLTPERVIGTDGEMVRMIPIMMGEIPGIDPS